MGPGSSCPAVVRYRDICCRSRTTAAPAGLRRKPAFPTSSPNWQVQAEPVRRTRVHKALRYHRGRGDLDTIPTGTLRLSWRNLNGQRASDLRKIGSSGSGLVSASTFRAAIWPNSSGSNMGRTARQSPSCLSQFHQTRCCIIADRVSHTTAETNS
jgi:hypothetical protein